MHFKRLEMFGFKSFAEKTTLDFEPGITAIVGPNGCGKSNVFDAVRWVLGEQSIKQLRGSSSADVIFSGTDKRPPLGFAEVSLTFSNESKILPIEHDEVTVTRRLFRSGESEYMLNKATVRLKDIQELLMGTGIGAEAYSLVQQGKVDLVVSAKPEDRRMILDEASGITKYKAKKREAMNKLKHTEENLLRVNDITIEVKRQIGSIERQAKKAQRYKKEFEKLKCLEYKTAKSRIDGLSAKKKNMEDSLKKYQDDRKHLVQQLEELNTQLTDEINHLGEIEQKINDIHSKEIKLDGQIDLNNRQIGFNQERTENLLANDVKIRQQKEQLVQRCAVQQEKIEKVKQSIATMEGSLKNNKQIILERKNELSSLEKAIHEAKQKIREHEEKILSLTSNQVNVRNQLTDIMKELQGGLARKRRLELENEKVSSEMSAINEKMESITGELNKVNDTVSELTRNRDGQKSELNALEEKLHQLRKDLSELDKKKLFLKSQKEFLEKMHAQYHDMPDPVIEGRIITTKSPMDHHTGIIGKVKEVHRIGESQLQYFKEKLGEPAAQELYEIICETKFIELDPQQIAVQIEEIAGQITELEGQKSVLTQLVQTLDQNVKKLEEDIQDKETERSVLESQKNDIEAERQKLQGELEVVEIELSEVKDQMSSYRKREEEYNYKLDTINQDLGWCQNDIKEKQGWISQKTQEKENISVAIAQMETEVQSAQEQMNSHQENLTMFNQSLDNWLEEMKTIDDELVNSELKRGEYVKETEALKIRIEETRVHKESLKDVLSRHEREKEDTGKKINGKRAGINTIEEKLDGIEQQVHEQQLSGQELAFSVKGVRDRLMQSYKIDIDTFEQDLIHQLKEEKARSIAEEKLKESEEAQKQQNIKELSLQEQAEAGEEAELEASESETEDSESQEERQEDSSDEEIRSKEIKLQKILAGINRDEIEVVIEDPFTAFSEEQLEEELEALRKKCESFGNVNLAAMDEFEELRGRFEFLTKQQADLLEAKSQLMSTISKINRSTRQMFMDTFTKVSEEFRIYFRMLFGGGEAQLVLLDPDNVLESGIDIVARPPGKKLQNINLLSGGEKTLTAIALIFGVFKVNPSPFCVLDEIDAALDESNVGRFSYLLQDFSKIAQFIVITHNKKTISAADILYGVTMPETGCSRIVSVKLADDKADTSQQEVTVGA